MELSFTTDKTRPHTMPASEALPALQSIAEIADGIKHRREVDAILYSDEKAVNADVLGAPDAVDDQSIINTEDL